MHTLAQGTGVVVPGILHRLDKADTKDGIASIQPVADLGVPYSVLLYERFLGRPFLQAADGRVFTLSTMHPLIVHTKIREYRVR